VGHEILHTTLLHVSVHTKVKQIKRLATSSVQNNRTHTSEAANQFSDCRWTHSCPILNEHVCEVIPHLWLSWPRTCMFLEYVPYMICWINMRGWSGQSIHPIPFRLSVLIDTLLAQHGRAFPSITTKSWSTAPV